MSRNWRGVVLFALVVSFAVAQVAGGALIITSVTRSNGSDPFEPQIAPGFINFDNDRGPDDDQVIGALDNGSYCFVDREHVYAPFDGNSAFPSFLVGADYVLLANDDKTAASLTVDVTLSSLATKVYLFVDNRVAGVGVDRMTWVSDMGLTDTGVDFGIDEGADGSIDQTWSIFSMDVTGPVTLTFKEQNDGGSRNMYGLGAIPEPATLALLALGGLALIRRRK